MNGPSGGSAPRGLAPATAALTLYALLSDAVVETFLSGSAVRWWLVGIVLAFGVATWLTWGRTGWSARARLAGLALLGALAFAAWRPGGMEAGPRLLGQDTSLILSAAMLLSVALSGIVLARAPSLRRGMRVTLGTLAAYGVLALAWGIRRGSPFAETMSGAGLPDPLPSWFPGAYVAVVVVVPAALLVILGHRLAPGGGATRPGWQAPVAALLLVVLLAVAGVRGGAARGASSGAGQASAEAGRGSAVSRTGATRPPRSAGDFAAARDALDERLARLRSLYEATERPAITPAEIGAELGGDPHAILAFVAGAIRYEPYLGVLRGARGVLAAGGGNSADMAILLQEMLAGGGLPRLRFAVATLTQDQAKSLVERAMASPPARPARLSRGRAAADTTPPPEPAPPAEAAVRRDAASAEASLRRAREHVARLERALPPRGATDGTEAAVAAARQHVWLELEVDDGWVALDPTGMAARVGEGAERFSTLPPRWHHRVHAKLEVERLVGTGLLRETLVEREWEARRLDGRAIEVGIAPSGLTVDAMLEAGGSVLSLAAGFDRFEATLGVDGGGGAEAAFDVHGNVLGGSSSPLGDLGAVDPFARFGRPGGTSDAPPADQLAGVWLTLTLESPDGSSRVIERSLLDRVGPAARTGDHPSIRSDRRDLTTVRLALAQRHRILVALGPVGSDRLGADALAVLVEGDALQRALSIRHGETPPSQSAIDGAELSVLPAELVAMADAASSAASAAVAGSGIAFMDEPNVLILSHTFAVDEGAVGLRTGIDLARSRLVVLGPDAARTRLLHGALLSELEAGALAGPGAVVRSAAGALAAADRQRVPLRLLRAPDDVSQVDASDDARAVMRAELRSGNVLLATVRPVADAGSIRSAWWRIDPQGNAVAVGEDGRGQAGVEDMNVLSDISIPSVERTMKFTACLNSAVAAGGALNESAADCMSQAIQDIVESSLKKAIESYVTDPLQDAATTQILGEEYQKLYDKAKDAWERFSEAGEAASGAAGAGREIGGAFGFRIYLLLTMGSEIAAYASKL